VNNVHTFPIVAILATCCLILAALLSGPSCTTVAGLLNLTAMTDEEFDAWYPIAAGQLGAVARSEQREGKLSAADAQASAEKLRAVAEGETPVPSSLADLLGVRGWGSAVLEIAVLELDAELDRQGGWGEGGKAMKRAKVVAAALALEFEVLAPEAAGAASG
jgi:hypothetical protein